MYSVYVFLMFGFERLHERKKLILTRTHADIFFLSIYLPNILTLLLFVPDLLSAGLMNDDATSSTLAVHRSAN
jgi:hypothetical protein